MWRNIKARDKRNMNDRLTLPAEGGDVSQTPGIRAHLLTSLMESAILYMAFVGAIKLLGCSCKIKK